MAHSAGLMAAAEAHPKFKGRVSECTSTGDVDACIFAFLLPFYFLKGAQVFSLIEAYNLHSHLK